MPADTNQPVHVPTPASGGAVPRFTAVLATPAADPAVAQAHFAGRLAFETDVADLMFDLAHGHPGLVLIDTRSPGSYALCHIRGAINLPRINSATVATLPYGVVCVVYCWGPACNGATKGALRLAQLGFKAKELIGGIEYWRKEGGAVEGTLGNDAPLYWQP